MRLASEIGAPGDVHLYSAPRKLKRNQSSVLLQDCPGLQHIHQCGFGKRERKRADAVLLHTQEHGLQLANALAQAAKERCPSVWGVELVDQPHWLQHAGNGVSDMEAGLQASTRTNASPPVPDRVALNVRLTRPVPLTQMLTNRLAGQSLVAASS